jgi:hypothetical protein
MKRKRVEDRRSSTTRDRDLHPVITSADQQIGNSASVPPTVPPAVREKSEYLHPGGGNFREWKAGWETHVTSSILTSYYIIIDNHTTSDRQTYSFVSLLE